MQFNVLNSGSAEAVKTGVHVTALGLMALMGAYNAAAWLQRRQPHLAINAVLYAVLGGFRDNAQIGADPVGLPSPWVFSNYGEILGSGTFWRQVYNSTLIAGASTLLTVPLAGAGAIIFLWLTGQSINAVSLIGIVVMIGMADRNEQLAILADRRGRWLRVPRRRCRRARSGNPLGVETV